MNRHEMIKMTGVAALSHVVFPTDADADPMLSEATTPKLFRLVGEHVEAWCSALTLEDAEVLFQQNLEPLELSATSLREVKEDEWSEWGIRKAPVDAANPSAGEARLLACNRREFH